MATFAIYKFNLSTGDGHLFNNEVNARDTIQHAQTYFNKLFQNINHFFIYKNKNNDQKIEYTCNILSHHHDITILKLFDEKSVQYWEKLDSTKHRRPSNPYCHIIIDNRPNTGQILIERCEAFNYKTDDIRDLLQDHFRNMLVDFKLTIDIIAKMKTGDFWDIIEEQKRKFNDRITKITFSFPNPNTTTPIDAPIDLTTKLKALTSITKLFQASKGSISLDAAGENALRFEQTKKDMAQMVTLCAQNGYDLQVKFQQSGLYRINHDIKVYHTIVPSVTNDFINQQEILDYTKKGQFALINVLDEIRQLINDYNDEEPIIKKPTRRNQSAVR